MGSLGPITCAANARRTSPDLASAQPCREIRRNHHPGSAAKGPSRRGRGFPPKGDAEKSPGGGGFRLEGGAMPSHIWGKAGADVPDQGVRGAVLMKGDDR